MDTENPIITLRVIEEIYNKDASLFIHLKNIHLPCTYHMVETWGSHEFQDDYLEVGREVLYIDSVKFFFFFSIDVRSIILIV